MDEDLDRMTHDELVAEARRLRDGIRRHQIAAKTEYMTFFRQGDWRYTRYSTSNVAVKRLGTTAVVAGRADRAIFVNGRETVGAFAFTHVWTRSGDAWRLASSQLTTIPPPRPIK